MGRRTARRGGLASLVEEVERRVSSIVPLEVCRPVLPLRVRLEEERVALSSEDCDAQDRERHGVRQAQASVQALVRSSVRLHTARANRGGSGRTCEGELQAEALFGE